MVGTTSIIILYEYDCGNGTNTPRYSSWQQYEAALARAENEAAQRRGGEARKRQARRAEKRQREEWGGQSAERRAQRNDRRHRRTSGQKRARAQSQP